jgi:hypothetical protein
MTGTSNIDATTPLQREVAARGFAIVTRAGTDDVPEHSYTVGLGRTNRPEYILFGFSAAVAVPVLQDLALRTRDGERFAPNTNVEDVLPGMPVALLEVPADLVAQFLPEARGFAPSRGPRALQVVWPDGEDRFPWQSGYDGAWRHRQLLLQPGFLT